MRAVALYDFTAREDDELSLRRGERLVVAGSADDAGWVLVRRADGIGQGLVPLNHIRQTEAAASTHTTEEAERLGQSRALPDWGYDHGVPFQRLQPEHPLWMQSALESFVHSLLFNTTSWRLADVHMRQVMRRLADQEHHGDDDTLPRTDIESASCEANLTLSRSAGDGGSSDDGPKTEPAASEAVRLLESYTRRHRAALAALEAAAAAEAVPLDESHRFVVAEAGSWGLGNRLYSLVSCLALALATNRTLLVRDWFGYPSELPALFAPPAGLRGGWNDLSYEAVAGRVARTLPGGWEQLRAEHTAVLTVLERNAQRHVVGGQRRTYASSPLSLLCAERDVAAEYPQRFLHVLSNSYFAPLLLRNPRHAPLAAALGARPFHLLARHLLRPSPSVAADVASFLAARRREAATVTTSAAATAATAAAASFGSSSHPQPPSTPPPSRRRLVGMHARTQDWMRVPLGAYWSCMRRAAPPAESEAWLVAADADIGDSLPPELRASAPAPLAVKAAAPTAGAAASGVAAAAAAAVAVAAPPVWQRRAARTKRSFLLERDAAGLHDAAVDLFLLAECDALLVSPMSSFGGFAHGFARSDAPPWKVTTFGRCVRGRSAEPFFHHWQDVHRQMRAAAEAGAPAPAASATWATREHGGQCALPDDFYESAEAHDLGLWLLGGETTPEERRLLVEEPDSARFMALLARRATSGTDL